MSKQNDFVQNATSITLFFVNERNYYQICYKKRGCVGIISTLVREKNIKKNKDTKKNMSDYFSVRGKFKYKIEKSGFHGEKRKKKQLMKVLAYMQEEQ